MANTDQTPPARRGIIGRLALVVVLALAIFAAWRFGVFNYLNFEALRAQREALSAFVTEHLVLSFAAFIAVYVVVTALAFPGAFWVTILGGYLFGLVGGAVATTIGATLGATVLFVIARYLLADTLRARAGPFLKRLEAGFKDNAISYLLTLRLVPVVPFFIANVAPAFLGARLTTFVWTTAIGIIPGVIAYTWIGAGLGAAFDAGEAPDVASFARQLAPAFIALALLAIAPAIYRHFKPPKPAS
ncbi:MAG: TVP38/TMEM64 family protein [Alphaproteobacteria bacterium]|nr:MAG: TVP38/TMEM64 family protein [Alphaproteobacteria bacterium]